MKNADLDALFKQDMLGKIKELATNNADAPDPDLLEDAMIERYLQWLKTPNEALGGLAPGAYFAGAPADELVLLLISTVAGGKKPSDPLLDAIADNSETDPLLLALLRGESDKTAGMSASKRVKLRCEAADLLNQKGSRDAIPVFFQIVLDQREDDVLRSAAADGIAAQGEDAKEALFDALNGAIEPAASVLLDLLCNLEPDERTVQFALKQFDLPGDRRAFYAELLARCGDDSVIPRLRAALRGEAYYTYTAIRNAIEALGGSVDDEPDFSGDSDYETVKGFDENEPLKGNE